MTERVVAGMPPSVIPDIFSRESIFQLSFPSWDEETEGWIPDY